MFVKQDTQAKLTPKPGKVKAYKSTKTTSTSGKNPLFVPDVYVVDWQVAKIDERFLKMNFVLEKQGRRRSFERMYHCFNGVIAYE